MGGLTRSLKYAAFRAGRIIGATLLASVGFVFYFMFLNGERFTVQNIVSRFPFMLVYAGNLIYLIYGMLDVATYTQCIMSYGCTRRDVLISTVFMHVLEIAATEAVMLLVYAVPKSWEMAGRNWLCGLALLSFLVGSGLALIIGIVIRRFGKIAYVVFIITCGVAGGVFGALIGVYGSDTFFTELFPDIFHLPLLAGIGCIWYVTAVTVFWLCIRKIEVRV